MRSRGSACGVCILEAISADTPGSKARYAAFLEGLQQLGWTPGRNVQIEVRYAEGDEVALRKYAAELETDAIPQIQGRRYRYPEAGGSILLRHVKFSKWSNSFQVAAKPISHQERQRTA
jgi:hypothetical protein